MKGPIGVSAQGEQMIDQFIRVIASYKNLSPKTLKEYASDLKHFIAWFEAVHQSGKEGVFHIEHVVTSTLLRYREAMQEAMELKPATINRRLVTLKQFFEWAVNAAKITHNPSKQVKLVPENKASPRQMTDAEEAALIAATKQYGSLRDQTIVCVMLHTGLRPMEVCDLMPGDIHIHDRNGYLTVRSGVRNKSRQVTLNETCIAALAHYLAKEPPCAEYLFASEKTGARLTERALRHLIHKYMSAAELVGLRAHDLRHRFGYVMAARTELHRLAQIMGHDRLSSTMVYVKETRSELS